MENTVSGTVHGAVVQARDVYGGVHIHPQVNEVVPRQLPLEVATFSGRDAELGELESALSSGAAVISAVNGTAGVGTTALALHWAHRAADRFPDGQLYVNMRGFEPDREPMVAAEAVRGFLDAFAVPSDAIPVSLDAQAALFRSVVAGRRVLLVLDNVRTVEQVRPLLPGSSGCFVVVTSRWQLPGLVVQGARPLRLDRLSGGEAIRVEGALPRGAGEVRGGVGRHRESVGTAPRAGAGGRDRGSRRVEHRQPRAAPHR